MGEDLVEGGQKTDEICAQCELHLDTAEEVFLIQAAAPHIISNVPRIEPILDEDTGDFSHDPYFLHFSCWEEITSDLQEQEKGPPVPDELSVTECCACGSGIREGEPILIASIGELRVSRRSPSLAELNVQFYAISAPDIYCTYCASVINENWITFWNEGLGIDGECLECQHVRCWRGFDCGCTCHQKTKEEPQEEEENG